MKEETTTIAQQVLKSPKLSLHKIKNLFKSWGKKSADSYQDKAESDHGISQVDNISEIISSFQEPMDAEDWGIVKYLLDDTIYLINTDTGGQTAFLDLMSRFLMGPALNLIISRLVDSLEQLYKIYCTNEEGVSTEKEDSVVTLEEVILQTLASIACLETSYDPDYFSNSDGKDTNIEIPECSSKAMFVGTFRDKVSQEEFEEKDRLLLNKIKPTEFYHKGLVLCASKKQLMFTLDNLNGRKEEILIH